MYIYIKFSLLLAIEQNLYYQIMWEEKKIKTIIVPNLVPRENYLEYSNIFSELCLCVCLYICVDNGIEFKSPPPFFFLLEF